MNVLPVSGGSLNPKAILTISRECGSGGREIGKAVARELGYEYIDRESILADIRKDGPKWEQWAKNLDEHCPTVWEKYDWSFRGFAALVQRHILEHAERGGVVIATVKAGIATDPRFFIPTLDVAYDGKEIILRGVTHTPKEHKHIEEAARQLAGGNPIRCELHYRE